MPNSMKPSLWSFALLACAASAQSPEYGGVEEGCVDVGEISVVTLATPLRGYQAVYRTWDLWRAAHPDREIPLSMHVYQADTRILGIGNRAFEISDPATHASIAVPTLFGAAFQAPTRGFSRESAVSWHEFLHHYVTQNRRANPYPLMASGTSRERGAALGLLRDDTADFRTSVWPGDEVVFNELPRSPHQIVQSIAEDGRSLVFAPENAPASPNHLVYEGDRWRIESRDFMDGPHWNSFAQTGGSFEGGADWEDLGNGLFSPRSGYRFGPIDLYLMGLLDAAELPEEFWVLRNADHPLSSPVQVRPQVWRGVRRTFTRGQFLAGLPGPPWPDDVPAWGNQPRNFHIRFVALTSVGVSINLEALERLDQVRRDSMSEFRRLTRGPDGSVRGTMTSTLAPELPDLAVAEVQAPEAAGPGERVTIQVQVQNQGRSAAGPFAIHVRTRPASLWLRASAVVEGLAAHEERVIPLAFTVPSETALFGSQRYLGSFTVLISVDPLKQVQEADEIHNAREVAVSWTPSASTEAPSSGKIVAGPAMDGTVLFVAREGIDGAHSLEAISAADPMRLSSLAMIPVEGSILSLVAREGLLAVGRWRDGAGAGSELLLFRLPLTASSEPVRVISLTSGFSSDPNTLAFNGEVLYAGFAGGFSVVRGMNAPAGAGADHVVSYAGNTNRLLVSGTRLFVAGMSSVMEFDAADPLHPLLSRTLPTGEFETDPVTGLTSRWPPTPWDIAVNGDLLDMSLLYQGIRRIRISTGAVVAQYRDGLPYRALAAVGPWLLAQGETNVWTVLSTSSGALTRSGSFVSRSRFPWTIERSFGLSPLARDGWAVLADAHGVRFFSPTGVGPVFVRGDAAGDGSVNSADLTRMTDVLYGGAPMDGREDAFDANDDGALDISDVVFLSRYLYQGGTKPPAPFPSPGIDPTPDALGIPRPR
ncbi:MAG: hypothetical protein FD180_3546 [Planctomycetota bacterium]|nr:MAG: hypothetical protein FD180_3546 [Planctomycetota bacterium]